MTRKNIFVFILCAFSAVTLVLFSGCDKKASLNGNVARPTWTAPAEADMTSSMTAVIKVDLAAQYPDQTADWQRTDDDLLAAFAGEKCLGIAKWVEEGNAYWLYIASTDGYVTLKYYSTHYKNLFVAENAFQYLNDTWKGTVAEPFIPQFVVAK